MQLSSLGQVDSSLIVHPITSRVINYENSLQDFQFNNLTFEKRRDYMINYLDTVRTTIDYRVGSSRYQNLKLAHSQVLNSRSKIQLLYDKNTWDGHYSNSIHENDDLNINYQYEFERNALSISVQRRSLFKGLNEGVVELQEFEDTVQQRSFISVRNETASTRMVQKEINIEAIRKNKRLLYGFEMGLNRFDFSYMDTDLRIDSLWQRPIYQDSLSTNDHFHEGNEEFSFLLGSLSKSLILNLGIHRHYYRNIYLNESFGALVKLSYRPNSRFLPKLNLQSYIRTNLLVDFRAFNEFKSFNGRLCYNVNYKHGNESNFYNSYQANYYSWNNDLKQKDLISGNVTYADDSLLFYIRLNSVSVINHYYFDGNEYVNSISNQSDFKLEIAKRFMFWPSFWLSLDYSYWNQLKGDLFRYPSHIAGLDIHYSFDLLKEKLKCKILLENNYRSSFEQYGFNSSIFAFIPEPIGMNTLPQFYYADIAFQTTIAQVQFEIGLKHLNQGLTPYNYYDLVGHPGKDRFLTFGVKVKFDD